ncbi:MAG: MFS transporter [Hirschia sp.]|nr:MFS transporter [Hirschia sp.]MBF18518.1 MFS transporter [Hirschia sp.]
MTTELDISAAPRAEGANRWLVVAVLLFVYTFNFLDRQLLSILQEPIKQELGLSDGQLGLMTGLAFALVYTVFGVIVGVLADRTNRVKILCVGCTLWSLFTLICGLARSFPVMLMARAGVGVGEAAGAPPSYSIIADYFPPHKRGLALAIFGLGVPFGVALGAAFGARIHDIWGWRAAFVSLGMIGLVSAMILPFIVKEPARGRFDPPDHQFAASEGLNGYLTDFIASVKMFIATPILRYAALAAGFSSFASYAALNWNASFLIRVQGADFGQIATWYALMLALSIGASMLISGAMADWMAKRSRVWYGWLPAMALVLCVPFHLLYVSANDWRMALIFLTAPSFLSSFYFTPALTISQNTAPPHQRTAAGALYLLITNLIGLGGGPFFVGLLSDQFSQTHGPAEGLRMALYAITPFFLIAAGFLVALGFSLRAPVDGTKPAG